MNKREFEQAAEAHPNGPAAVAYAIMLLADEMANVAFWLKYLGTGDAATPMGAIEFLGKTFEDRLAPIGDALDRIAAALEPL